MSGRQASLSRLDWFDTVASDPGYQSVIAVAAVPDADELVFGLQRSSDLVVTNRDDPAHPRLVSMADGYGNAVPMLGRLQPALWAVDYDTLVRIDRRDWAVTAAVRLQSAPKGTRRFVGSPWLPTDESLILVPRPGSGDVVVVDPDTLAIM
ncbi:MAG: hypothetical protein FWF28_06605 [Micrococcales bacterium]|nr:hypothetical protein [Micrococcales bacterium]